MKTHLIVVERFAVDQSGGALLLINPLEVISSSGFPLVLVPVWCVAFLERKQDEPAQVVLQIYVDLNGQRVWTAAHPVAFDNSLRAKAAVQLIGVPVTSPGRLAFSVGVAPTESATWECDVLMVPMGTAPPTSPSTIDVKKLN